MTQKKSSSAEENTLSTAFMNKVLRAKRAKELFLQRASVSEIARQMDLCWTTVKKYVEGSPEDVCSYHRTKESEAVLGLTDYREFVIAGLSSRKNSRLSIERSVKKAMLGAMNLSNTTAKNSNRKQELSCRATKPCKRRTPISIS